MIADRQRAEDGAATTGGMPQLRGAVQVTETGWGYVVASGAGISRRAVALEQAAGVAGIGLFAVAGGQWLVPQVHAALGLPSQMTLCAVLAVLGVALCWIPERGLAEGVQVDLEGRSLRCTLSNSKGSVRIWREVGFDLIGSVFVSRSKTPGVPSKLFARVGGTGGDVIEIARGPEAELTLLKDRISADLLRPCLRRAVPIKRAIIRRPLPRDVAEDDAGEGVEAA